MATTLGLSGPAWACLSAHCVQVRVDTGRLDLSSDVAAGRFLLQGSMTTMNGDVLGPGALVGPSSLFPGVPADPIASSSDAALLVLPAPAFDRLREAHPQVALDVLGAVATAIVQRGSGTATWRRDICKWRRLACLGEMRVQSALQERDRLQKDVDELRREVRRAVGAHRHCDAREEALRAQLMQALRQVRSRQAALEAQVALNASLGRTAPPPARRLGSPTTLTRSVSSVAFGQPAPRSRYRLPNTIKTNGDDDGRRAATPAVCTFRKTYDQVDLCVGSTRPGTAQDGPGTTRRATGTPAVVVECRQQRRAQHCQASSTLVPFSERAMNRGVSTNDIVFHLAGNEVSKVPKDQTANRIATLCSHLVTQRSLYPLDAPPPAASIDRTHASKYALRCTPDVIILPSSLGPFVRSVDDVLFINPGQLVKGSGSGGLYSRIVIHPGGESTTTRSRVDIARI